MDVIASVPGTDPGAILDHAGQPGEPAGRDLLIVDTAGRLQTKFNLIRELEKLTKVAASRSTGLPTRYLLVIDGSTGQNAILQAKGFMEATGITGIVLTKLDGTSKGGAVLDIKKELGVPVRFVGTGKKSTTSPSLTRWRMWRGF